MISPSSPLFPPDDRRIPRDEAASMTHRLREALGKDGEPMSFDEFSAHVQQSPRMASPTGKLHEGARSLLAIALGTEKNANMALCDSVKRYIDQSRFYELRDDRANFLRGDHEAVLLWVAALDENLRRGMMFQISSRERALLAFLANVLAKVYQRIAGERARIRQGIDDVLTETPTGGQGFLDRDQSALTLLDADRAQLLELCDEADVLLSDVGREAERRSLNVRRRAIQQEIDTLEAELKTKPAAQALEKIQRQIAAAETAQDLRSTLIARLKTLMQLSDEQLKELAVQLHLDTRGETVLTRLRDQARRLHDTLVSGRVGNALPREMMVPADGDTSTRDDRSSARREASDSSSDDDEGYPTESRRTRHKRRDQPVAPIPEESAGDISGADLDALLLQLASRPAVPAPKQPAVMRSFADLARPKTVSWQDTAVDALRLLCAREATAEWKRLQEVSALARAQSPADLRSFERNMQQDMEFERERVGVLRLQHQLGVLDDELALLHAIPSHLPAIRAAGERLRQSLSASAVSQPAGLYTLKSLLMVADILEKREPAWDMASVVERSRRFHAGASHPSYAFGEANAQDLHYDPRVMPYLLLMGLRAHHRANGEAPRA